MANVKTILYKQKTLKSGKHPVMLYIYEDKIYRLSLGYSFHLKEWDEKSGKLRKNHPNAKTINLNIRKKELLANEILDDFVRQGKRFEFDEFKRLFKGEQEQAQEEEEVLFYDFFKTMIEEKKALGKVGTADAYKDACKTLQNYHPQNFKFEAFNYALLKGLENHLYGRGCTGGGIGARMRSIKAVYYEAIRRGHAKKEQNPYSTTHNRDGYSLAKLKSNVNPKALDQKELAQFKNFDLEQYPALADSWRYFMFSFKMFGMNFIDMCNLTNADISGGRLHYTRQKTSKPFNLLISVTCSPNTVNYYW